MNKNKFPNWKQIKGGKARIAKIKNKDHYFKFLHLKARLKAKKVKHITDWELSTRLGKEVHRTKTNPLPLIVALLFTDGHAYKKKKCWEIGFASKSLQLSHLFLDLVSIWNRKIIISKYVDKNSVTRLYFHLPIENELLELSKSFKTSPRNQSVEDYLKEYQPSFKFMKHLDNTCKKFFLRIIFSTDGGITIKEYKNGVISALFLRCAHPLLCKYYKNLANEFFIKLGVEKDKSKWYGIGGLITTSLNSKKIFQEIGGFVEGVKISKKSKYFYGVDKNWLLDKCINNKNRIKELIITPH